MTTRSRDQDADSDGRPVLFEVNGSQGDQLPEVDGASALDARTASHVERRLANPLTADAVHSALRPTNPNLEHHRPGEGDPTEPGGPINWHDMADDEYDETMGALTDFLTWALPRWGFTTDQIPTQCWWQHPDIIEELTAWWGLWQTCVRNPTAPGSDQITYQERTFALKQRLESSYRGRCRHAHLPAGTIVVSKPESL